MFKRFKRYVMVLLIVGLLGIPSVVMAAAENSELKIIAEAWYYNKYPLEKAAELFVKDHPEVTYVVKSRRF